MNNYVISLTSATERRRHIEAEFGKQDIPFKFFDAITPDIMQNKASELGINISKSTLTKGEISCALSHIALWHLAKEKDLNYICIFEDDIYLGENIKPFLSNNYINENIDIVKLEKNISIVETGRRADQSYSCRELYKLKSTHPGTAGYLITRKGISYLLDKIKNLQDIEIDNLMFNQLLKDENYTVWQLQPALCIQDAVLNEKQIFHTTISGRENRNSKSKKKLNLGQKLKKEINRIKRKFKLRFFGKHITFK